MRKEYYVIGITDHPAKDSDKYVVVPAAWVRFQEIPSDRQAIVKYPGNESISETKERVKCRSPYSDEWPIFVADILHGTDSYEEAEEYVQVLENILIQERSYAQIVGAGATSWASPSSTSSVASNSPPNEGLQSFSSASTSNRPYIDALSSHRASCTFTSDEEISKSIPESNAPRSAVTMNQEPDPIVYQPASEYTRSLTGVLPPLDVGFIQDQALHLTFNRSPPVAAGNSACIPAPTSDMAPFTFASEEEILKSRPRLEGNVSASWKTASKQPTASTSAAYVCPPLSIGHFYSAPLDSTFSCSPLDTTSKSPYIAAPDEEMLQLRAKVNVPGSSVTLSQDSNQIVNKTASTQTIHQKTLNAKKKVSQQTQTTTPFIIYRGKKNEALKNQFSTAHTYLGGFNQLLNVMPMNVESLNQIDFAREKSKVQTNNSNSVLLNSCERNKPPVNIPRETTSGPQMSAETYCKPFIDSLKKLHSQFYKTYKACDNLTKIFNKNSLLVKTLIEKAEKDNKPHVRDGGEKSKNNETGVVGENKHNDTFLIEPVEGMVIDKTGEDALKLDNTPQQIETDKNANNDGDWEKNGEPTHDNDEDEETIDVGDDGEKDRASNKTFYKQAPKLKLPEEYDKNDSRWTLNYRKKEKRVVELLPQTGVYVNKFKLRHCQRISKDGKALARNLMVEIFTKNALSVCSMTGKKANVFNYLDEKDVRPKLDEHAIDVLLSYVENYCREKNWLQYSAQDIISTLRNKMQDIRYKRG